MPTIVLLWELNEDEREWIRLWRLLGTVAARYRQGVLGFVREFARISGCEGVDEDEVAETEPVGRVVHYAAVRDLQAAPWAEIDDGGNDDLALPAGVPLL